MEEAGEGQDPPPSLPLPSPSLPTPAVAKARKKLGGWGVLKGQAPEPEPEPVLKRPTELEAIGCQDSSPGPGLASALPASLGTEDASPAGPPAPAPAGLVNLAETSQLVTNLAQLKVDILE